MTTRNSPRLYVYTVIFLTANHISWLFLKFMYELFDAFFFSFASSPKEKAAVPKENFT